MENVIGKEEKKVGENCKFVELVEIEFINL
jgi:hypothetical protein